MTPDECATAFTAAGGHLTRGRHSPPIATSSTTREREEHRDTLGMPDVLDEYPVPGPRSMDGVLGFSVTELGDAEVLGRAARHRLVRQRFGLVHGGTYAALAEMLATEGTGPGGVGAGQRRNGPVERHQLHAADHRGDDPRTSAADPRGADHLELDMECTDDQGRLCAVSRVTVAVRPRSDP